MGEPHVNEIYGMIVSDAKDHLSKHGKTLRIINEDGVAKMVTMDIDINRVNVFVRNNTIVSIENLG